MDCVLEIHNNKTLNNIFHFFLQINKSESKKEKQFRIFDKKEKILQY